MRAISDLWKTICLLLLCVLSYSSVLAQDMTPPELRCKTGLVVVLPISGTITVSAAEFDDGSSDDVTAYGDLKFYLNGDPTLTTHTVNCDTFTERDLRGEYSRSFFLYVEDEAGNVSICGTMLRVQDNKFICGDPYVECSGCPYLWSNNELIQAYINCTPNDSGCYAVTLDSIQEVRYCLDEGILNGVTTKDLVQLQRHLLGITPFEHPFQMVAADVNNSQSVSAADISSLRKVILGSEPDFQRWGLDSYRFLVQSDPNNPMYTDVLVFDDLNNCPQYLDFWAIKTGDVAFEGEQVDDIEVRRDLFEIELNEVLGSHIYTIRSKTDLSIAAIDLQLEGTSSLGKATVRTEMGSDFYTNTGPDAIWGIWLSQQEATVKKAGEDILDIWSTGPLEGRLSLQIIDQALRTYAQTLFFENKEIVELWPNPAREGEVVTIIGLEDETYCIIDVRGQLVRTILTKEKYGRANISLEGVASGVYFVVSASGDIKARLVVE